MPFRKRFMEVHAKRQGNTPQQGVTLSRSVLRIAGDGHVEGAAGGGSSSRGAALDAPNHSSLTPADA